MTTSNVARHGLATLGAICAAALSILASVVMGVPPKSRIEARVHNAGRFCYRNGLCASLRCTSCEKLAQAFEKPKLGGMHFFSRRLQPEKRRAIDLRKFFLLAGSRRPFQQKGVASQHGRIAITFECPCKHGFSALVLDTPQRDELACWLQSRLFFEFSPSRRHRFFACFDFALRNKPRACLLLGPKRPAKMNQKRLQFAGLPTVHQ